MVLFSTANAFRRQERVGVLGLLGESRLQRGVRTRILVPPAVGGIDKNYNTVTKAENERGKQH